MTTLYEKRFTKPNLSIEKPPSKGGSFKVLLFPNLTTGLKGFLIYWDG